MFWINRNKINATRFFHKRFVGTLNSISVVYSSEWQRWIGLKRAKIGQQLLGSDILQTILKLVMWIAFRGKILNHLIFSDWFKRNIVAFESNGTKFRFSTKLRPKKKKLPWHFPYNSSLPEWRWRNFWLPYLPALCSALHHNVQIIFLVLPKFASWLFEDPWSAPRWNIIGSLGSNKNQTNLHIWQWNTVVLHALHLHFFIFVHFIAVLVHLIM